MRAGHHLEHQRGVGDRARHRGHEGVVAEGVLGLAVRDDANRLLEANDTVACGRNASRAAAIGRDGNRTDAARDGDSGPAA